MEAERGPVWSHHLGPQAAHAGAPPQVGLGTNTSTDQPTALFFPNRHLKVSQGASRTTGNRPGADQRGRYQVNGILAPAPIPAAERRCRTEAAVWSLSLQQSLVSERASAPGPGPPLWPPCGPHSRRPPHSGPWGLELFMPQAAARAAGPAHAELSCHRRGWRSEAAYPKVHGSGGTRKVCVHLTPICHRPGRPSPPALWDLLCSLLGALLASREGGHLEAMTSCDRTTQCLFSQHS